jgi:hypothetical protein
VDGLVSGARAGLGYSNPLAKPGVRPLLPVRPTKPHWSESAIRKLDRDLGMTGTEMTRREDFKTLVADSRWAQIPARIFESSSGFVIG